MAGKSYKWANPQTAPRSTSTDWDDIRAKILEYYDLKDKEPNESFYLQLYGGGVWLMNSRDETLQLDMNILSLEEAARLLEVLKATEDRVVGLRGPVSHYSDAGRAGATTSTPRDDDQTYSMNEITKLLRESTLTQVKLSERLVEGMKSLVEENAKMNQNFERFTTKISGDVQQLMRSVDSLKLRGQDGQAVKDWQEKPTLSANNKPSIVSCTRPAEPIKLHPRGRGRGFRPANCNPLTLLAPGPREFGPAEPRCSSTLVADSYEWNEKNEVRREQSPYKDWRVESAERLGIALDDLNIDNSKQRTPEKSALLGFAEERNRSSDERPKSRERPNKRCERCGSTAHLSKDCKHDEPKCFNCNKFGHIAVDCSEPRKGPPRKRATDRNRSISPKRKQRREHSRSRSKSPFRRPGTPAKE
ncbi:uncharacterized protein LOC116417108 isoform X2 [Nasonia vitripennis]|uniref:CCHC-type domain-containing protein n=1 Tax=Nasonia vitripennis TaxID=7425 RepID=A0A7M7QA71_NASVI|nr:uncharacterized protein LOC116417108 isoform X2 [Nasonia vitripennis]